MRETLSLSGDWHYETSDGQTGEMAVPSNWHLAGLPDHAGAVTFRRTFRLDAPPEGKRATLRFLGVDYRARVWLNGILLGAHEGYFQPFEFDVTLVLRAGTNELVVEVDSPQDPVEIWPHAKTLVKGIFGHHDCRPGSWNPEHGQDCSTGGIWNDVELAWHSPIHIKRVRVAPILLEDGSARLRVTCRLAAPGNRQAELQLRIAPVNFEGPPLETARPVSLTTGTQEIVVVQRVAEPALWWPWDQGDQPLYSAEVTLVVDGQTVDVARERFGIRQIEVNDGWEFRINGRRFFPRGTNIIPTQWLSEYDAEMIGADVKLLRGANVNFIRVHAHVNRDELYAACDEAGILVWQDFALQWSYEESDDLYRRAAEQLSDMIDWLYNHPSIVVWCCHNEPSVNRHTLDPLLAQVAREADSTRHVDVASDFHYHPYPGWYVGHYTEFCQLPRAPFVSEFGAQALPDLETLHEMFAPDELWPPDWAKWAWRDFQYDQTFNVAGVEIGESIEEFVANSQAYQARLLQYAIEHYRAAKYESVTGLFQFMFVECWPSITWAVVDYFRRPKSGYEALKRAYQPVLPAILPVREVWQRGDLGRDIEYAVIVVNDLPRGFERVAVRTWVLDPAGNRLAEQEARLDLSPDSVTPWPRRHHDDGPRCPLLAGAVLGDYTIAASVHSAEGEVLGENVWTVEVVAGPH